MLITFMAVSWHFVCIIYGLVHLNAGLAVSGCIAGAQHKVYLWGFGTNNQLAKGRLVIWAAACRYLESCDHCPLACPRVNPSTC